MPFSVTRPQVLHGNKRDKTNMAAGSNFEFVVCSGEPVKQRPSSLVRQHVMNTYLEKNGKAKSQRPRTRKAVQSKKGGLLLYEPETHTFQRSDSRDDEVDGSNRHEVNALSDQVWTLHPLLNISHSFDPFNSLPVPGEAAKSLALWYLSENIAHLCAYELYPCVSENARRLQPVLKKLRWDTAMKSEAVFYTLLCVCAEKLELLQGRTSQFGYRTQKDLAIKSLRRMMNDIGMFAGLCVYL